MKRPWTLLLLAILATCWTPRSVSAQGFPIPLGNASAEEGEASLDGNTVVPVPQWTTTGSLTVVAYGTAGPFPDLEGNGQFFCGGPDSALSTATQTVAIPEEGWAYIDSEVHPIYAAAVLAGWESNEASPKVEVTLLDAGMNEVDRMTLGPLTRSARQGTTQAVYVGEGRMATRGTRFIRVTIEMSGTPGTYNAAFVDDVECWIQLDVPVRQATWGSVKASRSLGQ